MIRCIACLTGLLVMASNSFAQSQPNNGVNVGSTDGSNNSGGSQNSSSSNNSSSNSNSSSRNSGSSSGPSSSSGSSGSNFGSGSSTAQGADALRNSMRNDPRAATSQNSQTGRSTTQNRNSRGGQNSQFRNQGNRNQNFNSGMGQTRSYRASTQIAFEPVQVPATAVASSAAVSLGPQAIPGGRNLTIDFAGGVATISGTVPTLREARIAAMMVAMEPGVRSVDNRLVVAPPPPASSTGR